MESGSTTASTESAELPAEPTDAPSEEEILADYPNASSSMVEIIQKGSEAEGADREAILAAFTDYYETLASRDPEGVCARLGVGVKSLLAGGSVENADSKPDCPTLLGKLFAKGVAAKVIKSARQKANAKVMMVRIEDGTAYVIFEAPGAELYEMPMSREGKNWKMNLLSAAGLAPSS